MGVTVHVHKLLYAMTPLRRIMLIVLLDYFVFMIIHESVYGTI